MHPTISLAGTLHNDPQQSWRALQAARHGREIQELGRGIGCAALEPGFLIALNPWCAAPRTERSGLCRAPAVCGCRAGEVARGPRSASLPLLNIIID